MRWLLDGYNLIRRDPDLRAAETQGLETGRAALLRLIAGIARGSADRVTVVFDGAPVRREAPAGRLEVIFSRPPEKADDVLVRLARQAGRGTVVVTSDRMVRAAARRAGATTLGAEEFLRALAAPDAGEGADAEDEDEEEEADEPAARRGNPSRLSKQARAGRRALARLRRTLRGDG